MMFFSAVMRAGILFQKKEKTKCHLIDWGGDFLKKSIGVKKKKFLRSQVLG